MDGMTGRDYFVTNLGAEPLVVDTITFNNPVFTEMGFEHALLGTLDTLFFTVYFEPEQAILYTGTMTIYSNDVISPTSVVDLIGSGINYEFSLGEIIWEYQSPQTSTFYGFNSVKYTDDINGDGIYEVIAANENYLTSFFNGQSAGIGDEFGFFDTGWDPMHTGCVYYERGMVAAPDLDNDDIGDVVIGTTGGSMTVYAISGADQSEIWNFDTHNFGGQGGWVYEVTCEDDWNNDGIYDVLAAVGGPSGSNEPKSVFLINGANGNMIWRAHIGETVYSVRSMGDLNNDGYPEVICASADYEAHMLNGINGSIAWSHDIGYAAFSINRIDDLNNDNIDDVVAAAGLTGVYALSGANGNEIWHNSGLGITYYLEATDDLNSNGSNDVLVTSVNGTFYAFDGANGSQLWTVPAGSNVLSLSVTPDVDGDFIADACCGSMNGMFYAVSGATGNILFSYQHGTTASQAFDAVGWLPDVDNSGGIEFLAGSRDAHLYCFSGGNYEPAPTTVEVSITPVAPPIIIPASGGSFQFNAMAENVGTEPTTFDFWIMVTLPNGAPYGPVFLRPNLQLAPGASMSRTLTQNVPANAPMGNYQYIAYVGNYGMGITWDESSFPFSKSVADENSSSGNWNVSGWDDESLTVVNPGEYKLYSAYPNPFNPVTAISYQLPAVSNVNLTVYDIAGREVAILVNELQSAGTYSVTFDGSELSSGIYFARLTAGEFTAVKKMLLVK